MPSTAEDSSLGHTDVPGEPGAAGLGTWGGERMPVMGAQEGQQNLGLPSSF